VENISSENTSECVRATYVVETNMKLEAFVQKILQEQTIDVSDFGDLVRVPTCVEKCLGRLWNIVDIGQGNEHAVDGVGQQAIIEIDFPMINFDKTGGMPLLLAIVAGNVLADRTAKKIRLLDVSIPSSLAELFHGPRFGSQGIRQVLEESKEKRPFVGVIMRPSLGLDAADYAKIAYEIAFSGADFIKDDEKFVNPIYCPYEQRIPLVREALDRAYKVTGKKTIYLANVTTRADKLVANARKVVSLGSTGIMIDVMCVGINAIEAVAEDSEVNVPIYGHRAGYAALGRSRDFGIDALVLLKLFRFAGVDMLSVGSLGGTHFERPVESSKYINAVRGSLGGKKPSLPVLIGGVHPAIVENNIRIYGKDVAFFCGGCVHGHPDGIRGGVKAMKQAVEAALAGVNVTDYAKDSKNKELHRALEAFGIKR